MIRKGKKGGKKVQQNFTFTINEAIYFDKQQQIKEMLGIGIEPVISIEEMEDSLSIRGVMELNGEYVRDPYMNETENTERTSGYNHVEKVEPLSEEVNEFFHKFLIDISIPLERVHSIDEIELEVDHFDYKLKSSDEMIIETNLLIHGIQEVNIPEEQVMEDRLLTAEEEIMEEEPESTEESVIDEPALMEEEQYEPEQDNVIEMTRDASNEESIPKTDTDLEETDPIDVNIEVEPDLDENTEPEREEVAEEEIIQVRAQENTDDEATYLLNIFENEEETEFRKLKLYIVQPNDKIESIASRYDISSRQIVRTNKLEDEDINPGQIIYIPINYEQN